jgi:hypothetical protein
MNVDVDMNVDVAANVDVDSVDVHGDKAGSGPRDRGRGGQGGGNAWIETLDKRWDAKTGRCDRWPDEEARRRDQ